MAVRNIPPAPGAREPPGFLEGLEVPLLDDDDVAILDDDGVAILN